MSDAGNPNREDEWKAYYQKVEKRPPRDLFNKLMQARAADSADAADRLPPGMAIDLGCGDGTETFALLEGGWRVLAVDQSPDAIQRVQAGAHPTHRDRLQTQQATFDQASLTPADLIYAGLSLPFCPPEQFPAVWQNVRQALRSGGCIAAHLFGVRDSWASRTDMTFLTIEQVQEMLAGLDVALLREAEEDRPSAFEVMKHFHYFEVIARRK